MLKLNRSIDRSLTVLEEIQSNGTCSLALLAEKTGLPKPTLMRICATLENRRWLIRRNSDGCYQLGSAFPNIGGMPEQMDRLVMVAKESIIRLSTQTGLGVDLAVGIGGGRTEIADSTRAFRRHGVYPEVIGYRPSPVFSALGLSFLAVLPAKDRAKALQVLAEKLPREERASLPGVQKLLERNLKRGYAVRADGHWGRAVDYGALPSAIAVPILANTHPIGAINLVWKADHATVDAVVKKHLLLLQKTAAAIGQNYAEIAR